MRTMKVAPDEMRHVEQATVNIEDDLATVIESGSERVVYHDEEQFVAVLISAAAYESLAEDASNA